MGCNALEKSCLVLEWLLVVRWGGGEEAVRRVQVVVCWTCELSWASCL